jgi:hypothetical protein
LPQLGDPLCHLREPLGDELADVIAGRRPASYPAQRGIVEALEQANA